MTARLTADFWLRAYLARLRLADIPAYITAKGDPNAGAILVKCARLDGTACAFTRSFDLATGARRWLPLIDGSEAQVDETLARSRARDPDLWIIEIESRDGRTLLDEPGLSD